ncbi:MAG: hypothetical protein J7L71_01545 [Spirochaetaceae bacterium]|nr:hypothetical protein [Spirochaetaceae bacterium]
MGLKAMKIYIKVIMTVLLITIGTTVSAGSVWDGSVSTARYGYLPQSGLYAASNAFPQNTLVTVTNPDTGKTVDVTVLERLEDNTVFLALSADAAEAIGISYGGLFYGHISEQNKLSGVNENDLPYNPDPDINPSAASEDYTELAVIQNYIDNELGGEDNTILNNPGVEKPVENIPEIENTDVEIKEESADVIITDPDTAMSESVELVDSLSVEEDTPQVDNIPIEDVYVSTLEEDLPIPDVFEKNESSVSIPEQEKDIPSLVGMDASAPVLIPLSDPGTVLPELPNPESDKPIVTLLSVEPTEKTDQQPGIEVLPELPIIGIEDIEDETPLAVTLLNDVAPVEQDADINPILPLVSERDQSVDNPEISSVETPAPVIESESELAELEPVIVSPEESGSIPKEVEVILEPSEARPPVAKEAVVSLPSVPEPDKVLEIVNKTEVVAVKENTSNSYNVTKVLSEDSYYLQLGVYREEYSALALAGSLGSTYPVTVLISESTDSPRYKVMVGPLGADESGVVLYSFKSSGYPDAFLRKGL